MITTSTGTAATALVAPAGAHEFGWIVLVIIAAQLVVGALAVRESLTRRRGGQHRAG